MRFGIKPVRIRIKSGGIEHTSLDSLKHKFNLKDVSSLLDGRLETWLKQINCEDEANEIGMYKKKFQDEKQYIPDEKACLEFLNIFFSEDADNAKSLPTFLKRIKDSYPYLVGQIIDFCVERGNYQIFSSLEDNDYLLQVRNNAATIYNNLSKKDKKELTPDEQLILGISSIESAENCEDKKYSTGIKDIKDVLNNSKQAKAESLKEWLKSKEDELDKQKKKSTEIYQNIIEATKKSEDNSLKIKSVVNSSKFIYLDQLGESTITYSRYKELVNKFKNGGLLAALNEIAPENTSSIRRNQADIYICKFLRDAYRSINNTNYNLTGNYILSAKLIKLLNSGMRYTARDMLKIANEKKSLIAAFIYYRYEKSDFELDSCLKWDILYVFAGQNGLPLKFEELSYSEQVEFIVEHFIEIETEWKV